MSDRQSHIEQLDNFELKGTVLEETLDSLNYINKWLGNHKIIISQLSKLMDKYPNKNHFKIVDLGCGGGDVLRAISEKYHKKNITVELLGIDGNLNSLAYARSQSIRHTHLAYLQADILRPDFRIPSCDILISSHFIYHFSNQGLDQFLKNNIDQINIGFINSGLEKSKIALLLFKYFSWLLPINSMAKTDGLQAIKSAFKKNELNNILREIPNIEYSLKSVPFFRLSLLIE